MSVVLATALLATPAWPQDLAPPQLTSRTGASYTLFLNFSGFTWNQDWDNDPVDVAVPGTIPAYTVDGDATSFNSQELGYIHEIWSRTAEKYAPFNVNVTTIDPAAHLATDSERQAYYNAQPRFMHTSIGGTNSWWGTGGGVSYIGVASSTWGATQPYHLNFAWPQHVGGSSDLRAIAEVIAHEDGHGIGASHQSDWNGSSFVREYSAGTGTGFGSYAPVMGNSYNSERGLWSVGTDDDGVIQNDVQVFLSKSNFSVIPATAGQTRQMATPMTGIGGTVAFNLSKGAITTKAGLSNPDPKAAASYTTDYWSFTTTGGNVTLTANSGQSTMTSGTADPGATLDAFIQIFDSDGNVVQSSTGYAPAAGHLNATITTTLTAGDYTVRVSNTLGSGGAGLVDTTYTERSFFDMGSYFLSGTIPGLAHEVVRYWDNAGGNGFGNAGGTWSASTDNLWNTNADGSGTRGSNVSIATIDSVHFGTDTDGLAAGTVNVSGAVAANRITFGSASSAITLSGGTITMASVTPTITVNNASSTIGSVLAGNAGFRKEGSGTLVLSGANTLTGELNVAAGTVALSGGASLSRLSSINTSAAGARLDVSGISGGSITVGSLTGVSNSQIVLGAKNLSVDPATSTTYAGVISGTGGSLTKTGGNTLTLSGANTHTGGTTVNGGTLSLTGNNTYSGGTTIAGGTLAFNNVGLVNTTGNITFTGNGTLQWSAHQTDLSSRIVMTNGVTATINHTGTMTFASAMGNGSSGSLAKAGSGTLILSQPVTYTGSTMLNAGTLEFGNGILDAGSEIRFTGSSALRWATGNTQDVSSRIVMSNGVTATLNTNGNNVTFATGIGNSSSGGLTKAGGGTLTLAGASTYTGATTVSGGTLMLTGPASLSSTQQVNVSGGTARLDISGITAGGVTVSQIAGAAGSTIVLGSKSITHNGNGNTTFSGTMSGSGGSLTKNGTGTLTLAGANTHTGTTTVNNGTLAITASGSLANSTVNLIASGRTLSIGGITPASTAVGSIVGVSGSSIVLGTKNLLAGGNGASTTFAGVISGSGGSLTKTGSGTLVLSGANTYTGATTVSDGMLVIDATGSLASALLNVDAGGALGGAGTISGDVSFANGSSFDVSSALASNPLDRDWITIGGTVTFDSSFGVSSLLGIDWDTIEFGTYTLISTSQTNWGNLDNFGLGDAYFDVGSGKSAYFASGSLNLVVVPEPSTYALIGCLVSAAVVAMRRRRPG